MKSKQILKTKLTLETTSFFDLIPIYKKNIKLCPTYKIHLLGKYLIRSMSKLFLYNNKLLSVISYKNSLFFSKILNLGSTQTLQCFMNKVSSLYILENSIENKEELRVLLVQINNNCIKKKLENIDSKYLSILILFPNQTFLVQLVKVFTHYSNQRFENYSKRRFYKYMQTKNSKKLKYGKIILPADNRNIFQDGNIEDISVYGIVTNRTIKISKNCLNSDIFFTTPLSFKKKKLGNLLKNINFCWIDSLDTILMQNLENFLFIAKNLIQLRTKSVYDESEYLMFYQKMSSIIRIFIISSLIPNFLIKLFYNLSFSTGYFSKRKRYSLTHGIITSSKNCYIGKNFVNKGNLTNSFSNFHQFFFQEIYNKNKNSNLLIFVKNFSEIIPIRNILQKLKKKIHLKINILSEYTIDKIKEFSENNPDDSVSIITLTTERYFFYFRLLYIQFDSIYFQSYPFHREFYYEIIQQGKF